MSGAEVKKEEVANIMNEAESQKKQVADLKL